MDRLPSELISLILQYLDNADLVHVQQVSRRLLELARDNSIWKVRCFDDSRAEATRRRQQLIELQEAHIAELRRALSDSPHGAPPVRDSETILRNRSLANWEPAYLHEHIDYYEEYIQRHAKIAVSWVELPGSQHDESKREVTGAALLKSGEHSTHTVCSLDDGSVLIYDISSPTTPESTIGHSGPGMLTPGASDQDQRHAVMTETGAVESLSVNSNTARAFCAATMMLHEVDLSTMSLVSTIQYPFPITALSSCQTDQPLIVGTNNTVHMYDPREPGLQSTLDKSIKTELIAGPLPIRRGHISLSQPGPLAIMHTPFDADSVWVAGRFTSLLQYSLRSFPKLLTTFHSGARISSMTSLPYPYIPRRLDLIRNNDISISAREAVKSSNGWTAICAGEYKGKGSLELYSMSASTGAHDGSRYANRQTASASKLLSVCPHGGKLVYGDGDGNLRWTERDGSSLVRAYNINDAIVQPEDSAAQASQGLWASSVNAESQGDIVQKMLPFTAHHTASKHSVENLMLWTGDGRLGVLGFGPTDPLRAEQFHDAVELQAESASEKAQRDAERQFSMAMRRALERDADEVRFMRGLGMAV